MSYDICNICALISSYLLNSLHVLLNLLNEFRKNDKALHFIGFPQLV